MKMLVKQFMDQQISRRRFASGLAAMGFSKIAVNSIVSSAAAAQEPDDPELSYIVEGTGGDILIENLKAAGIEFIFSTTATGMTSIFDALAVRPEMKYILTVHEGQAASMAHGYELATQKTSALLIPGVAVPNASNNLYNAWKDRSAIAVLSDGNATTLAGRDSFQQMDDWLSPLDEFTKWSWQVQNPKRIGEFTRRAIKVANTPPGGPVYIRYPNNVLAERSLKARIMPQSRMELPMNLQPDPGLIDEAARYIIEAENPLIMAGSEITRAGAVDDLVELAELLGISVSQGFSVYGDFPFDHHLFTDFYALGTPREAVRMDTFINLGSHMPEPAIFSLPPREKMRVIHARIEYERIADLYPTDVPIAAGMKETVTALTDSIKSMLTEERIRAIREPRMEAAKARYTERIKKRDEEAKANWNASPISWERLSYEMEQGLEEDAVIVSELDYRIPYYWLNFAPGKKRLIGQTTGFALGWCVGAALGVKMGLPDKQVVAVLGDGAMLFGQLEVLWSASRYDIPVTIIIFNNRSYDNERHRIYQNSPLANNREKKELWRDISCYLGDPIVDFVGIGKAFDIDGAIAQTPEEFSAALKTAAAVTREGRPFIIDAVIKQRGFKANENWYPDISVADMRTRKV